MTPATDLHCVVHGEGTPVLALHGAYAAHEEVLGYLEPFFAGRPGYRRIYVDLPGMGASPAVGDADDALAAIEATVDARVGGGRFAIVAQSYGAHLARGLAARRPGRVTGLAMICPLLRAGGFAGEHAAVQVADDLGVDLPPELEAEYRGYFVVQTPETARRFVDAVAPVVGRFDGAAVERLMASDLTPDPDAAAPLDVPTLIVVGRQDAVVGDAGQWALRDRYPHATFAALDMAGHALPHERPAVLDALLADWLDRIEVADG